jgi:hypothetical protein
LSKDDGDGWGNRAIYIIYNLMCDGMIPVAAARPGGVHPPVMDVDIGALAEQQLDDLLVAFL